MSIDSLISRLKEAKFQCIDCRMEETAVDFDDSISMIEAQAVTIASLESRISQQARTIAAMCQQVADLERDASRLDWLDKNMFHREMNEWDARIHRGETMWVTFAPDGVQGSVRKVIDAASVKEKTNE